MFVDGFGVEAAHVSVADAWFSTHGCVVGNLHLDGAWQEAGQLEMQLLEVQISGDVLQAFHGLDVFPKLALVEYDERVAKLLVEVIVELLDDLCQLLYSLAPS